VSLAFGRENITKIPADYRFFCDYVTRRPAVANTSRVHRCGLFCGKIISKCLLVVLINKSTGRLKQKSVYVIVTRLSHTYESSLVTYINKTCRNLCVFLRITFHSALPYSNALCLAYSCHSVRYVSCWNKRLLTYLLTFGSSARYEQPRMRLKLGQRDFSYAAPAAWNSLPPSLQQTTTTDSFKRHLKTSFYQAF